MNGSLRLKFHIPHTFKQHEAPFVRALVTRNHGHCSHCGGQIFRNALKCTRRIYTKLIIKCYALTNNSCFYNNNIKNRYTYNLMLK